MKGKTMALNLRDEDIKEIESDLFLLKSRHANLTLRINDINKTLANETAKEYLWHGVLRRLNTIEHCVENIYSIFPLRRKDLLNRSELKDVEINLHAFFINIFGLLDNMAWVMIHENNLSESIRRTNVSLYAAQTQEQFSEEFRQYLNSDRMKSWHNGYLKDFRDALSHRIPLYVPPKTLNADQKAQIDEIEQKKQEAIKRNDLEEVKILDNKIDDIGDPVAYFRHSLSETNRGMVLHAQVIGDFGTIEEIVEKFCEMFES